MMYKCNILLVILFNACNLVKESQNERSWSQFKQEISLKPLSYGHYFPPGECSLPIVS